MTRALTVTAPAKLNWSLSVSGRRSDGFHHLLMLNSALSLADTLTLRPAEQDSCRCYPPVSGLNEDDNIALCAWRMLKRQYDLPGSLAIEIEKRIFTGGGLGGGSADAAAVLHGVNRMFKLGLSDDALAAAGQQLGADLPFCLRGGWAIVSGIGEIIRPLPRMGKLHLALVNPGFPVSTPLVFSRYKPQHSSVTPDMDALVTALSDADSRTVATLASNDLEAPAFELYPPLRKLKQRCLCFNRPTLMSGSGGSMWILAASAAEAKDIAAELGREYPLTAAVHTL